MRDVTVSRPSWHLWGAALTILVGLTTPSLAQDYDYGGPETFDRHAPPPPPPSDPDYGPGYQRPVPFERDRYRYRRRMPRDLVCRTPEGSCRSDAPQIIGLRCRCTFGDGVARGRMRP